MALLPNGVFDRNQFAAGRQSAEQAQQLSNASRANTPMQARNNVPPTTEQLIDMTIGQPAPPSQAQGAFGVAGEALANGAYNLSEALTPNPPDRLPNGLGDLNFARPTGLPDQGNIGFLNPNRPRFRDGQRLTGQEDWAPPPPPPAARPNAPGVNGGDVPASGPVSMDGSTRQMQGEWAPAPLDRRAPAPVAAAPIAPRGVYSDALTPQYSAENTRANGVPMPESGAGLSVLGSVGGMGGGYAGAGVNTPAAPNVGGSGPGGAYQPGQDPMYMDPNRNAGGGSQVVNMGGGGSGGGGMNSALQQAIDAYTSLDAGGGSEASRERTRARQVMETLAGINRQQIGADASVQSAGIGAQSRLGAAQIGANTDLQTTGMNNQTDIGQSLIDQAIQQRRNDIMSQWNTGRLGVMQQEAEAASAAAQPSVLEQLQAEYALQAAQGADVDPYAYNLTLGQPVEQSVMSAPIGERLYGTRTGGRVNFGFQPTQELALRNFGILDR